MNVVYTVTDANYLALTCGLVRSVLANEPSIDEIIIGSMGLTSAQSSTLSLLDRRVRVMTLSEPECSQKLHDKGWVERTLKKTIGLLQILEQGHRVFMLDSDCIVLRPFVDDLGYVSHIGVTRRERPALRKDMRLDHIASLFVGFGKQAIEFVEFWIDLHKKMISGAFKPPYETPALCKALGFWNVSEIDEIDEALFSKQANFDSEVVIAHLKSNSSGGTENLLLDRLEQLSSIDRERVSKFFYEVEANNYCFNISSGRKVFIDCGGHDGCSAVKFIAANPEFRAISFEPNRELWGYYDMVPTVLVKHGVAATTGEREFIIDEIDADGSSFMQGKKIDFTNTVSNELLKKELLQFVGINDVLAIFDPQDEIVLKLDVEGAEYEILEELVKTGAIRKINKILIEWHWRKCGIPEERHLKIIEAIKPFVKFESWDAVDYAIHKKEDDQILKRQSILKVEFKGSLESYRNWIDLSQQLKEL